MKAEYLPDSTIMISGARSKERFSRLVIGVGWPDQEEGYLCVVGARMDGRFHCIWETRGGLWALGDAAQEASRRFLTQAIVLDASDTVCASYFRTMQWSDPERDLQLEWMGSADETLADYEETGPVIAPVKAEVTQGFRSMLEMVKGMFSAAGVLVHAGNCPILVYTLRRQAKDLSRSPVMKALTWALWYLERESLAAPEVKGEGDMWYKNPSRTQT